jgi:hypothetical protein
MRRTATPAVPVLHRVRDVLRCHRPDDGRGAGDGETRARDVEGRAEWSADDRGHEGRTARVGGRAQNQPVPVAAVARTPTRRHSRPLSTLRRSHPAESFGVRTTKETVSEITDQVLGERPCRGTALSRR